MVQLVTIYKNGEPMLVAPSAVAGFLDQKGWSDTPGKTKAKGKPKSEPKTETPSEEE
jgi:hypothetical protein